MLSSGILSDYGISHLSIVFSRYRHEPCLGECVCQENTSDDKWDHVPWFTTRKCCITILYNAIENTLTKIPSGIRTQRTVARLGLISC